ncbi:hypothetical protein J5X84_07530 [Streptosporangiaceae bacterium NEAU-GS5]|nr:hypothetical protein [Streptosporangiaceae bacterium NEAU-GS5]
MNHAKLIHARVAGAVFAAAALVFSTAAAPPRIHAPWKDPWQLRWSPSAYRDGLNAFEGNEDDRRGSDPETAPHIYPVGNLWRFDMHVGARDGADRQRNEVRGMRERGVPLEIRKDETWRISYQMYIPDTLDATSQFTHIWQMKTSDTSSPLAQLSLPIKDGVAKIQARYWTQEDAVVHEIASVDLEPLQNKWISTTLEFKSSDDGYFRWILRDGNRTLADARADHIDLWWTDEQYNRPKWGIYRSIRSTGLQDTYLLLRDLKAWQLGPATPPVTLPPPDRSPGAYEAERAGNIFEGANEPVYCSICSGGRKTILIGGNIYDYTVIKGILSDTTATKQMTIHAVVDGTQSYFVSVNGANAFEVPMTGTKGTIATVTVPVPLVAGVNAIRFFNLSARAPELDKIVIS